jgi:tRNA-binding protein
MGGQHEIDPKSQPYAPSKLSRKEDISIRDFFQVDIRVGTIVAVLDFPEMRKPSYKIEVDFGPVVGKLWSSAQITNYTHDELVGRKVVGTINLGKKKLPTSFISEFLVMGALNPDGTVRLLEVPSDTLDGSSVA